MKKLTEKFPLQMNLFYTVITLLVAVILTIFNSESIIVPALGLGLMGYALMHLYQLIILKRERMAFKVLLIEALAQLFIGGFLIYISFFADFTLGVLFGYLLGSLLIVRGTLYLYATDHPKVLGSFLIHVGAIIAGTYLVIQGDFTAGVVSGIIIAVALKRSLKTAYKAYQASKNLPPEPLLDSSETPKELAEGAEPSSNQTPTMDSIQWKE